MLELVQEFIYIIKALWKTEEDYLPTFYFINLNFILKLSYSS